MRVLVTGHRGYLGSVLTTVLRHARFDVVGLDTDLYEGCDFSAHQESVPSFDTDLRDIEFADLLSFDAVVHLADCPDDPSGELSGDLINQINHQATMRLAECCREAGVTTFLFASSCEVYGRCDHRLLTESDEPNPLTPHAESKLRCERDLAQLADERFCPIFLRLGSMYGISPRLRLDLIVNDLVGSAAATGCVMLPNIGTAYQPLVHVEDVARAHVALLLAPPERVRAQAFNIVRAGANHRGIDIANAVTDLLPDCRQYVTMDQYDGQSRRVDGAKLSEACPTLSMRWDLEQGVRQLYTALYGASLSPAAWRCERYRRALRLKSLMERGHLTSSAGIVSRPTRADDHGRARGESQKLSVSSHQ